MKKILIQIYTIALIVMISTSCMSQPIKLFAGRYTENGGKGIFLLDLNSEAGTFRLLSDVDAGPNPSYFCISKKKGLIYAADEVMEFNGHKGGGVTVLSYDTKKIDTGKVKELLVPYGGPCFISLSPGEDFLLFANYSSSSVAVVKLDSKGIPERVTDSILFKEIDKAVSHPHMISFGPGGKKVYLTDLGLDRIVIYDFDAIKGHLNQRGTISLPKGAGPRHFVFNSAGTIMYVINELNSTLSVFGVGSDGELTSVQTLSTVAQDFKGENACADIHLGKDEKFLYGSNRGENTIVVFRIEPDGKLEIAGRTSCGGNWPRNFVIDPSGGFILAGNEKSGNISMFRIDEKSGMPVGAPKDYKLPNPACLKF